MATATATTARASARRKPSESIYEWEGKDRQGRIARGEMRAGGENQVIASLRRQGVLASKVRRHRPRPGAKIKPRDIALLTRQLAAMLKAGVPLLQAFDIVGRGSRNAGIARLLRQVRSDIEAGASLSAACQRHPAHFSALYCNLLAAAEAAGTLDDMLERLATYLEKTEAIKRRVRSALTYPAVVLAVAVAVLAIIMAWVIPMFKEVFSSFGAELPAPTRIVLGISDFFVRWWLPVFALAFGGLHLLLRACRRSAQVRRLRDRLLLRMPVFGPLVEQACVARWTRTLATMFAAGVPLVEALDSVGGASGNAVYGEATQKIQRDVSTGSALTTSVHHARLFPSMVVQMCAVGEESGSVDQMLGKAADFYEAEVDEAVARLSGLLEPIIIVFLGTLIGGIVISMYLPIFKLGQVV
mgnify:CR=1 FL=1